MLSLGHTTLPAPLGINKQYYQKCLSQQYSTSKIPKCFHTSFLQFTPKLEMIHTMSSCQELARPMTLHPDLVIIMAVVTEQTLREVIYPKICIKKKKTLNPLFILSSKVYILNVGKTEDYKCLNHIFIFPNIYTQNIYLVPLVKKNSFNHMSQLVELAQ